ncbi:galactosylceramide sulfotransferase-like [Glandiceps talaboti]
MRCLRRFGLKIKLSSLFCFIVTFGVCLVLFLLVNIGKSTDRGAEYVSQVGQQIRENLFDQVWRKPGPARQSLNLFMFDENEEENGLQAVIARKQTADKNWPGGINDESYKSNIQQCTEPRENITFLKIHKTGSSTIQNILLRYGYKNDLKFVLPPQGHYLGYPNFFDKKYMIEAKDGVYNIFCHHARFNNEVITEIMPPNTIYVTILRDPVTVFESAFTYFLIGRRCGYTDKDPEALEKFLQDPWSCYNKMARRSHVRNPLFFDFGMEENHFDNDEVISQAIKMIDKKFSLIMIAEYFEESIILLKEHLCWNLEDFKYFKINARNEQSIRQLNDDLRVKISSWNNADVKLYEHFNKTFWTKVREYGEEKMKNEVAMLREKNEFWKNQCLQSDEITEKGAGNFRIFQPPGVKINNFQLKPEVEHDKECNAMVLPEIQFTSTLRTKQFPNMYMQNQKKKKKTNNKRYIVY